MRNFKILLFFGIFVSGVFAGGPAVVANGLVNPSEEVTKDNTSSWLLPEVVVNGQRAPLVEEQKVGEAEQPRWTATRRFPSTRVYVIPDGEREFEFWVRPTISTGGYVQTEFQYEMEIGLPSRFQIDLYLTMEKDGLSGPMTSGGLSWEVRYALADWGKIPFNPTLYFEYEYHNNEPDAFEAKLLLGDELVSRWHWGFNLVCERQIAGDFEQSLCLRGGLSYTVIDMNLSAGVEAEAEADSNNTQGAYQQQYVIGPSIQWKPYKAFHIDFAYMFGIGAGSPAVKSLIVAGWEL